MSRVCPQCGQVSGDSNAFCIRCGYRFQGNEQVANEDATLRQINIPALSSDADPGATLSPANMPARSTGAMAAVPAASAAPAAPNPAPAVQQMPPAQTPTPVAQQMPPAQVQPPVAGTPPYIQPAAPGSLPYAPGIPMSDPNRSQASYQPLPPQQGAYPPPYGQVPYGVPVPLAAPAGPGALSTVQRAYAGKGVPVHHQSWLLDGKQVQPATLRASLADHLQKQGVLGISVSPVRLREHSVGLEERDLVRVSYGTGATSVYVYMAPMGSSLYVSRTSTVHQPLSQARIYTYIGLLILLLISLVLFLVINPSISVNDALAGNVGGYDAASYFKEFFQLAFFGLLFYAIFVLLRSVVSWLTEQDFLAFLRPNRLSDFTLDTLSSVEQITDKAIRETLKQAGLDAEDVIRSAQSYEPQQPLRRF
jgi:hypothetical protein